MTNSVYILGAPGVGKSTLMDGLMEGWVPGEYERLTEREFFGHYLEHDLIGRGLYLGRLREEFPGTDALSMSVLPQAMGWVPSPDITMVFGEGARLGVGDFLRHLADTTNLTVIYLSAHPEVLADRRNQRPDGGEWKTGRKISSQSAAWAKGQITRAAKAAEFAQSLDCHFTFIETTYMREDQVLELARSGGLSE